MNAGERERGWSQKAYPSKELDSREKSWMEYVENGNASDEKLFKDWSSVVPGSQFPCHLVVAAIQCMRNKGYDVTVAEQYIDVGLEAAKKKDGASLQRITATIYRLLNIAKRDHTSSYWDYNIYKTWNDLEKNCVFPQKVDIDITTRTFSDKIRGGWYGQLVGGALGTQIEGYSTENIRKIFGEIRGYIREPETYNDDITYELAFLEAFIQSGYEVTSMDIAEKWLELVADGYSGEEVALRNLRNGLVPPESGTYLNYYSDWIGAQMRTPIHGMVAPGNPKLAAKLAAYDSVISHSNSGLIGGVFNAVLVSLAYVETNMKKLLEKAIDCLPKDSEFYTVVCFALDSCKNTDEWEVAWETCEKEYVAYNWIHTYPNVAAEIVALWFGNGDFDETAYIITMAGKDVDCTAAPVLNVLGTAFGMSVIDDKWIKPLGEDILTLTRKYKTISIEKLCEITVRAMVKRDHDCRNELKLLRCR